MPKNSDWPDRLDPASRLWWPSAAPCLLQPGSGLFRVGLELGFCWFRTTAKESMGRGYGWCSVGRGGVAVQCKAVVWEVAIWGLSPGSLTR